MSAFTVFSQDLNSEAVIKTGFNGEIVSANLTRIMRMDNYHGNMNLKKFLEN